MNTGGTLDRGPQRLRMQLDLAVATLNDPLVWQAVETVAKAALERIVLTGPEIVALATLMLEPG